MEAMKRLKRYFFRPQNITLFLLISVVCIISARYNYLFFHTFAEGLAVVAATMTSIIAVTTYKYSENNYLLFIGIAFLFIAFVDALHLMSYQGMGIFLISSPNIPTQLWIAGRYLQGISLLTATFFIDRPLPRTLVFWVFMIITGLLVASIMWLRVFPDCYIAGQGLTGFKIASEWIISLIVLIAIFRLYRANQTGNRLMYQLMILAMTCFILSEISFTLYTDVYGLMNFIGHIFKIFSYSLIFLGTVFLGVEDPYKMISDRIKASANLDILTGLYNRRGLSEIYPRELARAKREEEYLGLMMVDLDNFKEVNDQYGHKVGDEVLQHFALILKKAVREIDVACRMGGDEFLIMANEDLKGMKALQLRVIEHFKDWTEKDMRLANLGLSCGIAIWDPASARNLDELIIEADREMYREKAIHKQHRNSTSTATGKWSDVVESRM